MQIPLTGPTYVNESQDAEFQRCVNMYVSDKRDNGRGGSKYGPLLPSAGLFKVLDLNGISLRGIWTVNNLVIVVCDTTVYKITIQPNLSFTTAVLGTINETVGLLELSANPFQFLLITNSANGYLYNYNTTGLCKIGVIGGSAGNTYNLTINGTAIYTNQAVDTALTLSALETAINAQTTITGVKITDNTSGVITLTSNTDAPITVSESGVGFVAGTNGITVTGGDFATGSFSSFLLLNSTNNLSQTLTPSPFPGASSIAFMDGYFIVAQPGTNLLWSCNLNDGRTWNPLNFTQANANPGVISGLAVQKQELWVLGDSRCEIYYDAGTSPGFPFAPRAGVSMTIGCGAPGSIVALNNAILFLDSRGYIVETQNSDYLVNTTSAYELKIISTIPMNNQFSQYPVLSDCIGMSFISNGHQMAQFDFPSANKSWCYDYTLDAWHERLYFSPTTQTFNSYLAQYSTNYNAFTVVGGRQSSSLYLMSTKYYDDAGAPIHRIRTIGPFNQEFFLITVDEILLRMESGLANQSGLGSNPYVTLRISGDGGHTWSFSQSLPFGQVGEYAKMIVWTRLGQFREWIVELTIVEPIKFSLIDMSARVTLEQGN